MAHFSYGNLTKKEHKKRFGVWLDIDINLKIIKTIRKNWNKRWYESIARIIVKEYYEDKNLIRLEIWCTSYIARYFIKKYRYNVFYIAVEPDENWSCYEDLGRGYK